VLQRVAVSSSVLQLLLFGRFAALQLATVPAQWSIKCSTVIFKYLKEFRVKSDWLKEHWNSCGNTTTRCNTLQQHDNAL